MNADDTSLDAAFDKSLQRAFSPVLVQLFKSLLEPTPSFAAIAGHLAMDPLLAGTVLHLANTSAVRGYGQKVTDIQRAAALLGTETLYRLVISLILQRQLQPLAPRDPEHQFADWRITLWGAAAADVLAEKICPRQRQAAYLTALLRDLPLLLAFCRLEVPDFIRLRGVVVPSSPATFVEEEAAWGRFHQDLAYDIMTIWSMPRDMSEAVRAHHDPVTDTTPPLNKTIAYATRWAEVVQSPDANPAEMVSFEMDLAADLGLNREETETLRAGCSERFTAMLHLLGIQEGPVESRYYEHSIDMLQTLHFLALEVCSESSPRGMADSLAHKLLSFWRLDGWELTLSIPGRPARLYTCRNGLVMSDESVDPLAALPAAKREVFPLTASGRRFGKLCVPLSEVRGAPVTSLALFMHVLAMNIDRLHRQKVKEGAARPYVGPANFARLDAAGTVLEAGDAFLSLLGLQSLPASAGGAGLLFDRFGSSLPDWEAVLSGTLSEKVWLLPGGQRNGRGHKPVVISLRPLGDRVGEFTLAAEELTDVNPVQAVALVCPNFLEILAANFTGRAFLLNAAGDIFWSYPAGHPLAGRNIFSATTPETEPRTGWTPGFLNDLAEPTQITVRREPSGSAAPLRLRFVPLPGCGNTCRLLCITSGPA